MKRLMTQPNTQRHVFTQESHIIPFLDMCPFSHNPQEGSYLIVMYYPRRTFLELYSLEAYVNDYKGGRGAIRDMEGMIQQTTQDCANVLDTGVVVWAYIKQHDGNTLIVLCQAMPRYQFSAQADYQEMKS